MRRAHLAIVWVICLLGFCLAAAAPSAAATPPANDDFADAETIVAPFTNVWAENLGATKEPGEPDHRGNPGGASVWFDWTAERTGGALISGCFSRSGRMVVAVYTGETVDALTAVPQFALPAVYPNPNCEYGFQAIAGTTYRIAVDGEYDPLTGTATEDETELGLQRYPSNDNFEDAFDLGQAPNLGYSTWTGSFGATKQPGEPDHAGNAGGSSVWFTWTAPNSGSVQVSACEATFTPLLAAYTGTRLSELTPVAATVGEPGFHCNFASYADGQLGFDTVAGTTYHVAVDGYDGASGDYGLGLVTDSRRLAERPVPALSASPRPHLQIGHMRIDPRERKVVLSLHATVPGSTFRCKLDHRRFAFCGAKVTYRHLKPGRHRFTARVFSPSGVSGKAAAKTSFVLKGAIRRSG